MAHAYQSITNGIEVSVAPRFLEDQSDPMEGRFVWSYAVEIVNNGAETVQLEARRWIITDGNGFQQEVEGPGVVGEQPVLNPGDSYSYMSGCPLVTPNGLMAGTYTMRTQTGGEFLAEIPAFSLDSPYTNQMMN